MLKGQILNHLWPQNAIRYCKNAIKYCKFVQPMVPEFCKVLQKFCKVFQLRFQDAWKEAKVMDCIAKMAHVQNRRGGNTVKYCKIATTRFCTCLKCNKVLRIREPRSQNAVRYCKFCSAPKVLACGAKTTGADFGQAQNARVEAKSVPGTCWKALKCCTG